jgi:hypothetical protein
MDEKKEIFIQKQSGLQESDYTINYQKQSKKIQLNSDQLIHFY